MKSIPEMTCFVSSGMLNLSLIFDNRPASFLGWSCPGLGLLYISWLIFLGLILFSQDMAGKSIFIVKYMVSSVMLN